MKDLYGYQGGTERLQGSRDAIRMALQNGLIRTGKDWMEMVESRIETVHGYDADDPFPDRGTDHRGLPYRIPRPRKDPPAPPQNTPFYRMTAPTLFGMEQPIKGKGNPPYSNFHRSNISETMA